MAWGNWWYRMFRSHRMQPGAEVCDHDQWRAPDDWEFALLKDRLWITAPWPDGAQPTVVLQTGVIKVGYTQVWADWKGPHTGWPGEPAFVTVGYCAETQSSFCGWTVFRDGATWPDDPFSLCLVSLQLREWVVAESQFPDPLPREVAVYWLREIHQRQDPQWECANEWFLRGENQKGGA